MKKPVLYVRGFGRVLNVYMKQKFDALCQELGKSLGKVGSPTGHCGVVIIRNETQLPNELVNK